MDVTALCIRLLVEVLVLLAAQVDRSYFAQKADAAFPRISPDKLQFFEYETISVNCEEFSGLSEWRVMSRLISTNSAHWDSSAPSCTIDPALKRHSGEYWCEDAEGQRSGAVNIAVTAGSVILEIPASPVVEGYDLNLHCRSKNTQSKHIADFYKNGSHCRTSYDNNFTIQNVSKSDEGLYKCTISGAGESPESWLAVVEQSKAVNNETHPSQQLSIDSLSFLLIVVGVLSVTLVLLVLGLLLYRKHRVFVCLSSGKPAPGSHSHIDHAVSGEDSVDSHHATYAVVKKQRKKKVSAGDNALDEDNVTYAVVQNKRKKKEPEVSRTRTKPCLPEESVIYSSVCHRPLAPD